MSFKRGPRRRPARYRRGAPIPGLLPLALSLALDRPIFVNGVLRSAALVREMTIAEIERRIDLGHLQEAVKEESNFV